MKARAKVIDLLTERAAAGGRASKAGTTAGPHAGHRRTQDHPVAHSLRDPARAGALLHRQRCRVVARGAARREPHTQGAGRAGVLSAWLVSPYCPLITAVAHPARPGFAKRARPALNAIGTHRGAAIGPAYEDKGGAPVRCGLRTCSRRDRLCRQSSGKFSISIISCCSSTTAAATVGLPADSRRAAVHGRADRTAGDRRERAALHELRRTDANVLFEGAQGGGCWMWISEPIRT